MRICILSNSSRYIWNFRINLIEALRNEGYDVLVFSPSGTEVSFLKSRHIQHVHIPLAPKSINPLYEIYSIIKLRHLLKKHNIDIVLSSTPKGNLYSAFAVRGTRRKQIANVSGLGSAYLRKNWLSNAVDMLYRICFKRIDHVFFENPTDYSEFENRGWIRAKHSEIIPGLGVDLQHFSPSPWPVSENNETRFLMIARLIADKGVREYVEAARIVRRQHPKAFFALLGDSAADNPTAIGKDELANWITEGNVVHYEHTQDVRPYIAEAHCLVLPSYREGMSRTLLEGGAMGRPLIASDVPGCREAIDVDINGLLCQPRSAVSLAEQITRFLRTPPHQQKAMGAASHQKIATEFNEAYVIRRYLEVLFLSVKINTGPRS